MKAKVNRKKLYEAASKAAKVLKKGISTTSNALYLEVKEEKIYFSGVQAQMAICTSTEDVTFDEPFSCLFDVDLFLPIMAKIKQVEVTLEYLEDKNQLVIWGGKTSMNLTCIDKNQWTPMKTLECPDLIMETETLFPYITQCKHALPTNEQDNVMSSFYVEHGNDAWKITALDGRRISSRGEIQKTECAVLLNGSSMTTLENIFTNGKVTLTIQEEDVQIEDDATKVLLRSVSGNYFNIKQLISNDAKYYVTVNREELLDVVELADIAVHNVSEKGIKLTFDGEKNRLLVEANDVIGNHVKSEVDISCLEPFSMQMGINAKYLIDALKNVSDETLTLELISDVAPIIFRGDAYLEVVLPIKIR